MTGSLSPFPHVFFFFPLFISVFYIVQLMLLYEINPNVFFLQNIFKNYIMYNGQNTVCVCVSSGWATSNPTQHFIEMSINPSSLPMTSDLGWPLHMVLPARGTRALLRPDRVSHPDSSPLSPIGEGIIKRESKTRARGELYPHKYSHEKEARLSSQRIELRWSENDSAFNCILLTPYHIFIHLSLSQFQPNGVARSPTNASWSTNHSKLEFIFKELLWEPLTLNDPFIWKLEVVSLTWCL